MVVQIRFRIRPGANRLRRTGSDTAILGDAATPVNIPADDRHLNGLTPFGAVITITPRGSDLIKAAAPLHAADVRNVLIDHLTAAELKTLSTIGDKVRERLAALDQGTRPGSG